MKGHISIGDFIKQVKSELIMAQDTESPFYELAEVTLELSFVLDVSGKAGFKLWAVEIGGESKAAQSHKVTLTLTPLPSKAASVPSKNAVVLGNTTQIKPHYAIKPEYSGAPMEVITDKPRRGAVYRRGESPQAHTIGDALGRTHKPGRGRPPSGRR